MTYADAAGMIVLVCIVVIAARYDLRERSIPYARLCVIGAVSAAFLVSKWTIFGPPPYSDILVMGMTGAVSCVMLWGRVFVARGDIAIIAVSGILVPTIHGVPSLVIILSVAMIVAIIMHISKTIIPNILELSRARSIFSDMDDTCMRKFAAFFLVHRRAGGERYCFSAQTADGRRFALCPAVLDEADIESESRYVITAVPFMLPYMIGTCFAGAFMLLGVIG